MMTHGLLGKAYAPAIASMITIIAVLAIVWAFFAPFWVVAIGMAAVALGLAGFISWIVITQPTSGEG